MRNYIVRNCPAYQKELVTMDFKTGETIITDKNYCINPFLPNACQDCTDCLLKRIANKCKAEKDKGFVMSRYGGEVPVSRGYDLACRILKELEIEECE